MAFPKTLKATAAAPARAVSEHAAAATMISTRGAAVLARKTPGASVRAVRSVLRRARRGAATVRLAYCEALADVRAAKAAADEAEQVAADEAEQVAATLATADAQPEA